MNTHWNTANTKNKQYVLLEALLPVCIKYTAQGESQMAKTAQSKAECYICHETLTKSVYFHTNKVTVL